MKTRELVEIPFGEIMAKKSSNTKSVRPSELITGAQRLNRVLAAAGLGSRRDVESLITEGRVEVDGQTITDLACKVDPKESTIEVDGTTLKRHRPVYFILNKPPGVLSTNFDPSGRTRVIDLVPSKERIFPVGRLDSSSEGLMLLTNDGALAQRLAHPKFGVQKTYFVVVQGVITHEDLAKLRKGVYLADGVARIDGAKIRRQRKTCTEIEILLSEGKNREIRRILARVGHKVMVLRRLAIGPLRLGQLPVGQTRVVTSAEVEALYAAASAARAEKGSKLRTPGKGTTSKSAAKTGRPRRADSAPPVRKSRAAPIIDKSTKVGSVLAYDAEDAPTASREKPRRSANKASSTEKSSGTSGGRTTAGRPSGSARVTSKPRVASTRKSSATRSAKTSKSGAGTTRRRGKGNQD